MEKIGLRKDFLSIALGEVEKYALEAIGHIDDEASLSLVARNSIFEKVSLKALKRISDETCLFDIVINSGHKTVSKKAINKINDEYFLTRIAIKSKKKKDILKIANQKIQDIRVAELKNPKSRDIEHLDIDQVIDNHNSKASHLKRQPVKLKFK